MHNQRELSMMEVGSKNWTKEVHWINVHRAVYALIC